MDKVVGWSLTEVNESLGCNVEAVDVTYILVESEFSIHLSSNSIRHVDARMSLENWKDIGYRTYLNHNTPWVDSQGSLEVFVVLLDNTLRDIIVISLSLTIKPVLQGNKQKWTLQSCHVCT